MPSSRTWLRCRAGTADRPISSTNTNRLSSERLYSVSQPAKNCPEARDPATMASAPPNSAPSATTPAVARAASRSPGGRSRRALRAKSAAPTTTMTVMATPHSQSGTGSGRITGRLSRQPGWGPALAVPPSVAGPSAGRPATGDRSGPNCAARAKSAG